MSDDPRAAEPEEVVVEAEPSDLTIYVCPSCRGDLEPAPERVTCRACGSSYPVDPYPDFMPDDRDAAFQEEGVNEHIVHNEDMGMVHKAREFYAPELARLGPLAGMRVLDDGCGSGKLVDELSALGCDAWGIDPVLGRYELWRRREQGARMARANGLRLPYPDGCFDAVVSNGVLEHVGEHRPDRREQRQQYVSEALRVLRPGGALLLGHPNGACPIDFWHGGWHSMRPHWPYERWMPSGREVRGYVRACGVPAEVTALSPKAYNSFERVAQSRLGRILTPPAGAVVWAADRYPVLRTSPLNPQLVMRIVKL